jgi:hypothetical protein
MTTEDRLRTALHAAADDTEIAPDSFDRIERRTVVARRRRRAVGGGLALAAVVALAAGVPLALQDDGEPVRVGPASDTRETTTTTSTTTTPPAETPAEPALFRWPASVDDRTFDDHVLLVQAFAEEYLGVVEPDLSDNGDDTTTVRPRREDGSTAPADGPRTVVEWTTVDGHVVVIGATSPNIQVAAPTPGAEITSPVTVSGQARNLYEGTVIVDVRGDGVPTPLATVPTTAAGSGPELAAFSVDVPYEVALADRGALVVKSDSGLEGTPEATVVPVRFGSQSAGETIQVTVYLQDQQGDFVPAQRTVPFTAGVLRASLLELLEGVTSEEEARGLTSPFDDDANLLRGVTITDDRTAVVDLEPDVVDALAGADGAAVLASLDHTVFQFPSVTWVTYRVDGGCESFAGLDTELLCERRSRDEY